MTAEEIKRLNLPADADEQLYVEAGLEWIRDNTTIKVDTNIETMKALPSSARLFLVKFCEICSKDIGVTGESVGPMSQNFSNTPLDKQVYQLARQLLKPYLKPNVTFIPCNRRWC